MKLRILKLHYMYMCAFVYIYIYNICVCVHQYLNLPSNLNIYICIYACFLHCISCYLAKYTYSIRDRLVLLIIRPSNFRASSSTNYWTQISIFMNEKLRRTMITCVVKLPRELSNSIGNWYIAHRQSIEEEIQKLISMLRKVDQVKCRY